MFQPLKRKEDATSRVLPALLLNNCREHRFQSSAASPSIPQFNLFALRKELKTRLANQDLKNPLLESVARRYGICCDTSGFLPCPTCCCDSDIILSASSRRRFNRSTDRSHSSHRDLCAHLLYRRLRFHGLVRRRCAHVDREHGNSPAK